MEYATNEVQDVQFNEAAAVEEVAVTEAAPVTPFVMSAESIAQAVAEAEQRAAQRELDKAAAKLAAVQTKLDAKAAKVADKKAAADALKAEKPESDKIEQNGVVRPNPDTACGRVWALADAASQELQAIVPISVLLVLASKQTPPLNEGNVKTSFSRFKKFHGVAAVKAAE